MTRGILRNKEEGQHITSAEELDRQEVIRNTQLNAKLNSTHDKSNGDILREKLSKAHEEGSEHLKWDELNLYKTEQEKNSTMKIDEPKTPYEGGFNPNGEYYKEDEVDDIPNFELGEGEFKEPKAVEPSSLNGGEILKDEGNEEGVNEGEQEEELTAEERHKRFEAMRKDHYHLKGNALKRGIQLDEEEDE